MLYYTVIFLIQDILNIFWYLTSILVCYHLPNE